MGDSMFLPHLNLWSLCLILHILCHWPLEVFSERWLTRCNEGAGQGTRTLRYLNTDIPPEPVQEHWTGSRMAWGRRGERLRSVQDSVSWFLSECVYGISGCWAVSNLSSLSLSSCQALLPQAHSLWCKADVSLPKETHRWKLSSHNTVAPFKDEMFSCAANFPDPLIFFLCLWIHFSLFF